MARFLPNRQEPVRFFVLSDGKLLPALEAERDLLPAVESVFAPDTLGLELPGEAAYADFRLRPDDMIFVRFIPEERKKRLVEAAGEVVSRPLDVLDAETEGMIGYWIERALAGRMPESEVATLLTRVEVDPSDPA